MNTTEVSWYNPEHGRDLNLNLVDPGGSNPSQGNISSGIHSMLLMHLAKNHRFNLTEHNKSILINSSLLHPNLSLEHPVSIDFTLPIFDLTAGNLNLFFMILYAIIVVIGAAGNFMTIYVVWRSKSMQTVTNMYICSVASADFILTVLATPFQAKAVLSQRWDLPIIMCKMCPVVLNLSVNISVFSMTCISVDRYQAIMVPLTHKPLKRTANIIILIVWIISFLISFPQSYYYQYVYKTEGNMLKPFCMLVEENTIPYHTFFAVLAVFNYFIPLFIITYSYTRICIRLKNSEAPGTTNTSAQREVNKRKVEKMLIIVVVLFVVCWTPYTLFYIFTFVPGFLQYTYINVIFLVAHWLAMSNSCYNPIIYALYSTKFRQEYHKVYENIVRCTPSSRYHFYQMYTLIQNDETKV
ncbi:substance-P receptor isoform X2 [Eurytemora carolleeae]|uniref:substance-P receptor isoform X2 n=1 Tax=Eurytemora carolleeae TaxID=1294199 RepID=UPI000C770616|nr:substance-P receptor isoform X2 [Eurytemora carolleeae]|eukprot:XP_023336479.1 substance-P receptor-like isoform X2 [Eurytemora affinis]